VKSEANNGAGSRILRRIEQLRETMTASGALLPMPKLHDAYALFRERFGPDRFKGLDGENLLNTMHLRGNSGQHGITVSYKRRSLV
jgi:hypothetical protein